MSAILSADDLNDFISPGVACIKPVETLPLPPPQSTDADGSLEHEVILDGQALGTATNGNGAPATQISLTDCLACSGCVTSAEAVLVSLQSHSELLGALDGAPGLRIRRRRQPQPQLPRPRTQPQPQPQQPRHDNNDDDDDDDDDDDEEGEAEFEVEGLENPDSKLFVASVSPQTRANLAAAVGLRPGVSERDAGRMIAQLLAGERGLRAGGRWGNAFTWVADTNAARDACLVLGAEEVLSQTTPQRSSGGGGSGSGAARPPILTSSCPGWVCYAEKTHPHVLPHMSRVKSPQALMGTLLKTTLSRRLGIPPHRIWHLAIMPCFDKKLEASREELTDAAWGGEGGGGGGGGGDGRPTGRGVRDVDCVITSREILMLAESRGLDFFGLSRDPIPAALRTPFPDPVLERFLFPPPPHRRRRRRPGPDPAAGTSGGNLYFALQYVAARHPGSRIETARGRNVDVVEYTVVGPAPAAAAAAAAAAAGAGEPIFRAARYYGFRNIQNLVRRLKPARPSRMPGARAMGAVATAATTRRPPGKSAGLEYAYVEVMACPGGCTNGGGQIKADDPVVVGRNGSEAKPGPREQKQWLAQVDEAYFSAEESETERDEGDPGPDGEQEEYEEEEDEDEEEEEEEVGDGGPGGGGDSDMVGGISPSYIHDTLAHWARITGIDIDRLTRTGFREVVSDVGKENKPSDTERVVQLAGKIGGGW